MKILHVISSLRLGGAEKLLSDLLPRQKKAGHEVAVYTFLCQRTPIMASLEHAGVPIIYANRHEGVYSPTHIIRLRRLMSEYDIVHTHTFSPQLFSAIAHWGLSYPMLITTEHNTFNRRRNIKGFLLMDRWMYKQYARVICISQAVKQQLNRYISETSSCSCVVHNGIDVAKLSQAAPLDLSQIVAISSRTDRFVLMVSAFRWEKDQKTLIKAFMDLPSNYHLLFAGTDLQGLQAECEQLVEKLNLQHRVHFLGVRTDIPNLLKAVDVVVQSTHVDGFCLAAVEGMAAGKPVVVSDVPGIRDIVDGYAVLFPHGNAEALASVIQELCENPDYAATIAARCQQRAKEFDISKMVAGYDALYHEIYDESCLRKN